MPSIAPFRNASLLFLLVLQTATGIPALAQTPSPTAVPRQAQRDRRISSAIAALRTADFQQRSQVIQDLTALGAAAIPELRQVLSGLDVDASPGSAKVSSAIAEALGDLGPEAASAVPELLAMVGDRRSWHPPAANNWLPIPQSFYYPTLGESTSPPEPPSNPEAIVGVSAIAALGQIGTAAQAASPVLSEQLEDSNPWVQLHTAWALNEIGAKTSVLPTYLSLLQYPEPNIRQATAQVIEERNLLSPENRLAEATPELLQQLVLSLADQDSSVRRAIRATLQEMGAAAVPPLVEALEQPNVLLRWEAAKVLGEPMGEASAVLSSLQKRLNDSAQYFPPQDQFGFLSPLPRPVYFPVWSSSHRFYHKPSNPDRAVNVEAVLSIGNIGIAAPDAVEQDLEELLQQQLKNPDPRMRLATAWALLSIAETDAASPTAQAAAAPEAAIIRAIGEVFQLTEQSENTIATIARAQSGSLRQESLSLLNDVGQPAAQFLVPHYLAQLTADYPVMKKQTAEQIRNHRAGAIIRLGDLGVASLGAVPLLRDRFLDGSDEVLRGYSATILGEIAMDTQRRALQGQLSEVVQQRSRQEIAQVAAIMRSGRYRFNAEPVERVVTALDVLNRLYGDFPKGVAQ